MLQFCDLWIRAIRYNRGYRKVKILFLSSTSRRTAQALACWSCQSLPNESPSQEDWALLRGSANLCKSLHYLGKTARQAAHLILLLSPESSFIPIAINNCPDIDYIAFSRTAASPTRTKSTCLAISTLDRKQNRDKTWYHFQLDKYAAINYPA